MGGTVPRSPSRYTGASIRDARGYPASAAALAASAGLDTAAERGSAAPPAVLLGVSNDGGTRWLVRVAPVSLRPLAGRRVRLGVPLEAWGLSRGGSRLAAVSDRSSLLHLFDVERMRTL